MPTFTTDVGLLRAFLRSGLSVSPWLIGTTAPNDRIDAAMFQKLDALVARLIAREWTEDLVIRHYGARPIPERVPQTAVYEIAASTAMSLALLHTATAEINDDMVHEALRLLRGFIDEYGLARLVSLYSVVTAFENISALAYYGEIPEREFMVGAWHRPWIDYSISDELWLGAYHGLYAIRIKDGRRYVTLTSAGADRFTETQRLLEESGYLRHRMRMLHRSAFQYREQDRAFTSQLWPAANALRAEFLAWSRIEPGMRVLEIGYGDGSISLNHDLAMLIGPMGRLDVLGISPEALHSRAAKRLEQYGEWVQFHHGHPELIPFPDATFDAVLAIGVLFSPSLDAVAREVARVLRPGGHFASIHPLAVMDGQEFYQDWCLGIARTVLPGADSLREYLLAEHQVETALRTAALSPSGSERRQLVTVFHHSESILHYFINGIGWLEEELAELPWKARQETLARMDAKSREVWLAHPPQHRTVSFPLEMIRAKKQAPAT